MNYIPFLLPVLVFYLLMLLQLGTRFIYRSVILRHKESGPELSFISLLPTARNMILVTLGLDLATLPLDPEFWLSTYRLLSHWYLPFGCVNFQAKGVVRAWKPLGAQLLRQLPTFLGELASGPNEAHVATATTPPHCVGIARGRNCAPHHRPDKTVPPIRKF